MKTKKLILFSIVLISLLSGSKLTAQDVHFSQMEYAPMTLNPALAGAFSTFQGVAMFRSQYGSFATPYTTMAASMDGKLTPASSLQKGIIGGGINFHNDRMGENNYNQTLVNISLAYHLMLNKNSKVGLGLSSGFGQASTNPAAGQWGVQYDGTAFNPVIASGESFYKQNFSYFDMGAGMLYSYKTNNKYVNDKADKSINVGVSAFHINRPISSFYNSTIQQLPIRYSVFVNGSIALPQANGAILPGIYYQRQKTYNEVMLGFYYKQFLTEGSRTTSINKEASFSVGLFTRYKDAMIIKLMAEWGAVSLGFSYDINISRLSIVSNFKGGTEVFVRYDLDKFSRKKIRVK